MNPLLASFTTWFFDVFKPQTSGLTALIIGLVAATGLALGAIKIRGFTLGIPGVMFTGLIFGRLLSQATLPEGSPPGPALNELVINFVRDFGLILFVYAVGVQVGPGFLASLRKRGLPLNLMAAAIVLIGAALSVGLTFITRTDIKAAAGLFAGGTTNAPAVGAATDAMKFLYGPAGRTEAVQTTLPAFAISYPFGLLGVILAMVAIRALFRISPQQEAQALEALESQETASLDTLNIELKNPNLDGLKLGRISDLGGSNVVVSRILHKGSLMIARPDTLVSLGDVLLAVGPKEELADFRLIIGGEAQVDLRAVPSQITTRRILVTHSEVLGKTVAELDLPKRMGVTITRVERAGIEFTALANFRLQFGDRVRGVGEAAALDAAAHHLGDSVRDLNLPRLLPIFIGIALGVVLGMLPVKFPGLPAPVRLGLAAGPMIVAIVLARLGRVGPLIYYMPHTASQMLREMGILLFLIAVGLQAGDGFFEALVKPVGLYWLAFGAVITLVPLLLVGLIAKTFFKVNYLHVCGLLCGSMTSPSLAFTHTMTASEAPAVAFATVYPLTMILRVLVAQLIVLIFR